MRGSIRGYCTEDDEYMGVEGLGPSTARRQENTTPKAKCAIDGPLLAARLRG